jgi:hypothetical protein
MQCAAAQHNNNISAKSDVLPVQVQKQMVRAVSYKIESRWCISELVIVSMCCGHELRSEIYFT